MESLLLHVHYPYTHAMYIIGPTSVISSGRNGFVYATTFNDERSYNFCRKDEVLTGEFALK
jgi:hypothetical protein